MITIVTTTGRSVRWPDEDIKRISVAADVKSHPTSVFGPAKADIKTREAPADLIARLEEKARKGIAQLTRPDGTPTWIAAPKVTDVRDPRPDEADPAKTTLIDSGGLRTAVRETEDEARSVLRRHGLKDGV